MEGMEAHFTIAGMWNSMTVVGKAVVIVLILMSIWSLTIAFERLWRFHRARRQSVDLAQNITPLLERHKLDEASRLARDSKYKNSHIARVLSAGLNEFQKDNIATLPSDYDVVDSGRRAVDREMMMAAADMKKGLGNLATISTTAPFIGLFGTVIGIINAFRGMAVSGSGGLGAVSAGIAEALFATAIGLFVAVPAVWLYNYFLNVVDRFGVEMQNSSSQLIDFFIRNEARARTRV
jgi:biopolymer transport protein ExbB/TolQ